ncbi:MAG TPA: hypothetical protein VMV19_16560 [Xanthobacteraceae bacterium]|nr:hypothetical protein [Xanthobacteraceae bacterium]
MQAAEYVDWINGHNSRLTIIGWFAGLAYYNWFASVGPVLPWWVHLILIVGGMFAASIVIGGGMSCLTALLYRIFAGSATARPEYFKVAGLIATVLAFFSAKYVLVILAPYASALMGWLIVLDAVG